MVGVEPVMVFSGHGSSMKRRQQSSCHVVGEEDPEACIEQGKRLLECMRSTSDATCRQKIRHEAVMCFQRGLRVTPMVERNCIAALRRVGVTVVVAPYEAEAQLASLCRSGVCHAVLTEDTNMMLYGSISEKPFPILYRFDSGGFVRVVSLRSFATSLLQEPAAQPSPSRSNNMRRIETRSPSAPASAEGTPQSALPPVPASSPNKIAHIHAVLLPFLCQLLLSVHGRRLLVQMCLLLGNDFIEPIFEGITPIMAQQLVVKFSEVHPDLRLNAIKTYVDSRRLISEESSALPRSPKSSASSYLDRLRRVEIGLHYNPVFDVKYKTIRNYSIPNYSPPGAAIHANEYPYPAVNLLDMLRLGHNAHILHHVPAELAKVVTIETLCKGMHGMRDFKVIEPCLPWEDAHIAYFSHQKLYRGGNEHQQGLMAQRGVWHNRLMLVRSMAVCNGAAATTVTSSASQGKPTSSASSAHRVTSLLAPSRIVESFPPPSSSVFSRERERFQREHDRIVEAQRIAAERRQAAMSLEQGYKSPPARKAGSHTAKNNFSPKKGEILVAGEVDSATNCDHHRAVAAGTGGRKVEVGNAEADLAGDESGNLQTVRVRGVTDIAHGKSENESSPPLRTPPHLLINSAHVTLSPDHHSRLVSTSHAHSERQVGPAVEVIDCGEMVNGAARMVAGKRKHSGGGAVVSVDGMAGSRREGADSRKNKKLVVTSIKSYFSTATPSVA